MDIGPTVSTGAEPGRLGVDEQLLTRLLQKAIRNTGVVDLEALCVSAGRKVSQLASGTELCVQEHVRASLSVRISLSALNPVVHLPLTFSTSVRAFEFTGQLSVLVLAVPAYVPASGLLLSGKYTLTS